MYTYKKSVILFQLHTDIYKDDGIAFKYSNDYANLHFVIKLQIKLITVHVNIQVF